MEKERYQDGNQKKLRGSHETGKRKKKKYSAQRETRQENRQLPASSIMGDKKQLKVRGR